MPLLEFLAQAFIGVFGITQPDLRQKRMVSLLLGGFILVAAVGAVSVVAFLFFQTHARH
jgi:hypothetical protein